MLLQALGIAGGSLGGNEEGATYFTNSKGRGKNSNCFACLEDKRIPERDTNYCVDCLIASRQFAARPFPDRFQAAAQL